MKKFYLGCDVSKGYADFVILNENKKIVEPDFQLDETFTGHLRLFEKLQYFFKKNPDAMIYAAVESTGGYENNWFDFLTKLQEHIEIRVARLNPTGVTFNSKADLNRNTTDKISAHNVAKYMIEHPEKVVYQSQSYFGSLRKQWAFVRMLVKQCTQLFNQLESLVYSANPEVLLYCKDGVPDWVLTLLSRYPTASKLANARPATVSKIPYVSNERAEELIHNAKFSIASAKDSITAQLITATVSQIVHLKKTIKAQENIMIKECEIPEVEILKTFNGIGDRSAIGLILEIQAVERFSSVKKLASFFGIHPVYKTSGDGKKGFRMSKMGRKEPRKILYMVTLSAIKSNPLIRSIYENRVENGMEKMAAVGLCMHKILRIIYGMLKNRTAFDPEVDINNRNKKQNTQKNTDARNRRYQAFDDNAPVSRRQAKKRVERKQSHSNNITKCGIRQSAPNPA